MSDSLLLEKSAAVATITFNRPDKANALDMTWLGQMTSFLADVQKDAAIRVVLLRGNGKHFMAGGDLELLRAMAAHPPMQRSVNGRGPIQQANNLVFAMRNLSKPIVASVQGGVAGSAVGMVAACDFIVAADNAFFFLAHVALGSSNDGLASYFLPRQIGARKALELALLGDRLLAPDALRLGFVNSVVPLADLEAESQKWVARLAAGPTNAYGQIKTLFNASLGNSLHAQGELEAECYGKAAAAQDFVEGIEAMVGKRPAKFKGM